MPLLKGHELQDLGKYGCDCENMVLSVPGLESSPGWGLLSSSFTGVAVQGSSVDVSEHLQFHRSRCRLHHKDTNFKANHNVQSQSVQSKRLPYRRSLSSRHDAATAAAYMAA